MKNLLLLCLLSAPLCGDLVRADETDDAQSLDAALLEDLGEDLLKPSAIKPTAPLDDRLLEQLDEDLGARQNVKEDWLSRVVQHMEAAEMLLQRDDEVSRASAAQSEALTGLDAMIAELAKRKSECSGGACKKPGPPKPGKKPGSKGKTGKSPAQAAPTSTSNGIDLSTELAVPGDLVKDLWGNLPQRQREEILQPLSEEFLPKYASEIEAYFRALADPQPREPAENQ